MNSMRVTRSLLTLVAAASLAMAQAKPAGTPGVPDARPRVVAASPAATGKPAAAQAPAQKTGTPKPTPIKAVVAKKEPAPKPAVKNTKVKDAKPPQPNGEVEQIVEVVPEKKPEKSTVKFSGKRDPFISVIRNGSDDRNLCGNGKKCLVISDLVLKGFVRSGTDKFAVVENAARRTYFLREKDPVFNGQVVRITNDEVVFRETVVDRVGRTIPREIVKRLPKG
jgi:Tfp pilus assembly protein PilP